VRGEQQSDIPGRASFPDPSSNPKNRADVQPNDALTLLASGELSLSRDAGEGEDAGTLLTESD